MTAATKPELLSVVRAGATNAIAVANEPTDLASLTDQEFEKGLARIDVSRKRMQRILESVLVEGAHYGNPNNAFQKPILFQAGAEELAKGFRLQIARGETADVVDSTPDFVQVTVHRAIIDGAGRVIDQTTASCSSKEKRFKRRDGKGFTFDDARECLNDCHAMAEKRAKVRLVRSALGLTAFLANEEEMDAALQPDKPITPMTEQERKQLYDVGAAVGIGKRALEALILQTLGRVAVGTGEDVQKVIAALKKWTPPKKEEAAPAGGRKPHEQVMDIVDTIVAGTPSVPAPAAPAAETDEDILRQDRELKVKEEGGELALGDQRPANRSAQSMGH